MLKYYKVILEKVSFDPHLFEKELIKAIGYLQPNEVKDLLQWSKINFGKYLSEIISKIENCL